VSNNDGTTFTEVSAIVLIVPLGAAARRALDAVARHQDER
jgi:phosphatidylinositol glycan class W